MRITNKDKEEYKKLVKATKTKVRNTVKKYGSKIHDITRKVDKKGNVTNEVVDYDIRNRLNIPSIESFKNRKEFNVWKEEQRNFTSGNNPHFKFFRNEHGTVMTDYLKLVLQNREAKAQKAAAKERAKTENLPFVKGLGTVEQNQMLMQRPKAMGYGKIKVDFKNLWNVGDIERKLIGMTVKGSPEYYQERKESMRDNFAELVEKSFNSDGSQLSQAIRELSSDDFYEMYMKYNWDFDYVYETIETSDNDKYNELIGDLQRDMLLYVSDDNAKYLKGF